MYCSKCGKESSDNSCFCENCGYQLSKTQSETISYTEASNNASAQFAQQQITKNKTEIMFEKLKKEKMIKLIVMLFLLILFFVLIAVSKSSNEKLVPAEEFSLTNSSEYDYVTADIICVVPFYEYYTESNGTKTTNYYSCIAMDTNYNEFFIKVPFSYYNEKLSHLECTDSFSYDGYETFYGTVKKIDSDLKNDLLNEADLESDSLDNILNNYCIEILQYPKTESDKFILFVVLDFILFLVGLIVFVKSVFKIKALKKAQNDYGDVIDIIDNAKANALYSDDSIAVTTDYIISNNKKITIVSTQEALCLYQYVHRTNFVVDTVALVVVNKYGEKVNFNYKATQSKLVPQVIAKIYPLFPNAVFGFNKESMSYVNDKKISR